MVDFVGRKNRRCLLEVIARKIEYCSKIITDKLSAYCRLVGYTKGMNYIHERVSHSENFVDPTACAHTQTVEGNNSVVKRQLRRIGTYVGDVHEIFDKIIVNRFKVFKRQYLFNCIIAALVEFSDKNTIVIF